MKQSWNIKDVDHYAELINVIEDFLKVALESAPHRLSVNRIDVGRTLQQNKSLHLYCKIQAQKLNDAGFTQKKLWEALKSGFDLPVTEEMVKDIFRSVGKSSFKKDSTKDLETTEIIEVYKSVDQGFAETTGVQTEWPSKESLMWGNK